MTNRIDIYTDASHYFLNNTKKHIFGYSGVILGEDKDYILKGTISRRTVRNYFNINCNIQGLTIEHGEMVAIAKSLWQFRNESQNIRIYSDCLNALKKIGDVTSGGTIKKHARKFNKLVDFIISIMDKIKSNGGSVELFWVKGHDWCYGNNIADESAKDMFVPKFKVKKMTNKQRKAFDSMGKKKKNTYRNNLISEQMFQEILKIDDKFFFDKETNEFGDFKQSLKSEVETPDLSVLEKYTETIKLAIKGFFDGSKNRKGKKVQSY